MRVPWTAKRADYKMTHSIGYVYTHHLMQRTDSLEKILMLGKIEGRRRRG